MSTLSPCDLSAACFEQLQGGAPVWNLGKWRMCHLFTCYMSLSYLWPCYMSLCHHVTCDLSTTRFERLQGSVKFRKVVQCTIYHFVKSTFVTLWLVSSRELWLVHHLFWTTGVKFRKVVQCTLYHVTLYHLWPCYMPLCHVFTLWLIHLVHHLFWTAGVKFRKLVQCTLSLVT